MKLNEMSIIELMAWKYMAYKGNANHTIVDAIQREVDRRVEKFSCEVMEYEQERKQEDQMKEMLEKWQKRYDKLYFGYFTKKYGVIRENKQGLPLSTLFQEKLYHMKDIDILNYMIYNYDNNTSTPNSFLIGTKSFPKNGEELREIRKALQVEEEG